MPKCAARQRKFSTAAAPVTNRPSVGGCAAWLAIAAGGGYVDMGHPFGFYEPLCP
jgi:hypothetical protein